MTNENRLVITRSGHERQYVALHKDKAVYLIRETLYEETDESALNTGAIYTGRIENIVDNLDAAFVRLSRKESGYLPLKEIPKALDPGDIRAGRILPVQIVSPARGSKLMRLTSRLSLSGMNTVLIYGETGIGCSAKIDTATRSYLTEAVRECLIEGGEEKIIKEASVIIRTEAASEEAELIAREAVNLYGSLTEILERAKDRTAGTILYRSDKDATIIESFLTLSHFLSKAYPDEGIEVITDLRDVSSALRNAGVFKDDPARRLSERNREENIASLYNIKGIVRDTTKRIVYLKSGGSIIIDDTEAMTVIDVNSGKHIKGKKRIGTDVKEKEALRINLEAAREALRQVRLRNITGMVLIDFINMKDGASYNTLATALKEDAAADPVRTRFVDFTALGIAELTRRRK